MQQIRRFALGLFWPAVVASGGLHAGMASHPGNRGDVSAFVEQVAYEGCVARTEAKPDEDMLIGRRR